jgi:dihydropteroate synthase-like protein
MKILAVTGKFAEKEVRKHIKDVHIINVDIAAFITPSHLKDVNMNGYDLVLVPGLAKGDWRKLEEEKGVKIRLGSIHASDLGIVLQNIDQIELSHVIPACRLLNTSRAEENIKLVDSLDEYAFKIGDVKIGGNTRMKIVAEIVDATELDRDALISKIQYYEESGADIIDIGIPLEFSVVDLRKTVKTAVDFCNSPVSIDTFSRKGIQAGIEAGAEMVMSISSSNIDVIDSISDSAVVVVEKDLNFLHEIVEKVRSKTDRIIADCLLDPLNITESFIRYDNFRKIDPDTPLLLGAGNVTELSDADSIGINAILAFMAEEVNADLLFTTEASVKTKGAVKELKVASYMAKSSRIRNTPPKDMGIDLLVLKDKNILETCEPADYIEASTGEFVRDKAGDFRIWVHEDKIICSHKKLTVAGDNAKSIVDTIVSNGLVSRLDHAAYLGRELKKAEIALKLGKNYVQDFELDFGIYS